MKGSKPFLVLVPFLSLFYCSTRNELETCLLTVIGKVHSSHDTLQFIFENQRDVVLPEQINNPRVVLRVNNPVQLSIKSYNNYVIFTQGHVSLNNTLANLKATSAWDESESARGKFLIITSTNKSLEKIMEVVWSFDIMNVILVVNRSLQLCTSIPFDEASKCAKTAILRCEPCSNATNISFYNTIQNVEGCNIKVVTSLYASESIVQTTRSVYVEIMSFLRFIGEVLNKNVTFDFVSEEKPIIDNRSEDISLIPHFARLPRMYEDYDVSDFFFRDVTIWAAPKAPRIAGVKAITSIFDVSSWGMIGAVFVVTTIIWWVTARFNSERPTFKNINRCILLILLFTLSGSCNLLPKARTLRLLALFYLIYSMHIYNVFQCKLISVLTQPGFERVTDTIEQFAELDYPVITNRVAERFLLGRALESVYAKIHQKVVVQEPFNVTGSVMQVAYYKNCSTFIGQEAMEKFYAKQKPMVDLVKTKGGLTAIEAVVGMRKGHYFLHTFNVLSRRIAESGFYDTIYFNSQFQPPGEMEESLNVSLGLKHFQGLFIWWAIGVSMATLIFVAELLLSKSLIRKTFGLLWNFNKLSFG